MESLLAYDSVPAQPGTYLLWFSFPHPRPVSAGRLGEVMIPAGNAVYVGSALGPGGLRARLRRHLCRRKAYHWHIDPLTVVCPPQDLHYAVTTERLECRWVHALHEAGAFAVAKGFGSSDCRQGCPAHLLVVPTGWTLSTIEEVLS